MALNWTMLSEDGSKPVPLPGEKVFFSAERCSLACVEGRQGGSRGAAIERGGDC